ncbi:MAG TPA: hypothetical protein VF707_07815 [Ardenticatenaceae bacterium]
MKPLSWLCVSFGCTLGLVVGLRLSMAGLLIVVALFAALLVGALYVMYWMQWQAEATSEIEVRVESPIGANRRTTARPLALQPGKRHRRGGWQHPDYEWFAPEESSRATT